MMTTSEGTLDPELQAASSLHLNTCHPLLATRLAMVIFSRATHEVGDRGRQEREEVGENDALNRFNSF